VRRTTIRLSEDDDRVLAEIRRLTKTKLDAPNIRKALRVYLNQLKAEGE
jgi:hypothetical protein